MPVRLRFSSTRSLIPSALIRWRTQCWQSHVEFELPDGSTLGSRWSLNSADNGVRIRPPQACHGQINVTHKTFTGIEDAAAFCRTLIGTPYNLKGIFGIATAKDFYDENALDCSHAVFISAEKGAHVLLLNPIDIQPWKITPRDLLLSDFLRPA